jgi:uncharacterized repeat protein (TIGR01451 family)
MILRPTLAVGLLALLGASALAQPHHPGPVPSPLLFVRFSGPAGMRVVFFQGRAPAHALNAPVAVGLRPGYCYRVQLTNFPGLPQVSLYPSIEVRGSLNIGPKFRAIDFPATVALTSDDLESALHGNLITKVIFLENPDTAEPTATTPGEILEASLPPSEDLVCEARRRGRVMLIVRIGSREPTFEELLAAAVPGTILYPDQRALSPAAAPPCLPVACWPWFDPYLGPKHEDQECLHDGGDRKTPVAIDRDGALHGLDSEDTVAEFTDGKGCRGVVCSNRCCICAPRYLCLRSELPPAISESSLTVESNRLALSQVEIARLVPPLEAEQVKVPLGYTGRVRPSINLAQKGPALLVGLKVLQAHEVVIGPVELIATKQAITLTAVQKALLVRQMKFALELSGILRLAENVQVIGTAVVGRSERGEVVVGTLETRDITSCCEVPLPPCKPLVLIKCADRSSAQVGDVVTFTITYSNHGGRPITDIAVSDSLAGRLEYIPESGESDRDAVLTMQENEAGSLILRWEIGGTLLPGQSGRLRFKAKLR